MSKEDTIRQFILSDLLDNDTLQISNNDSLFQGGLLDSLNLIGLISFLEKSYMIRINPSEITIDNFDDIDRILALINRKLSIPHGN